jgi:hypothetical protein
MSAGIIRAMRKIFLVCFLIVFAFLSACASDEERGPTEDVKMTGNAFELIEKARMAYVDQDVQAMKNYFTEGAYADMVRDVKKFERVELTFTPRWVDIKPGGELQVQVAWEGTWYLGADIKGEDTKEELDGIVTFMLSGKPYRISAVKMTSPFAQPDIAVLNRRLR